MFLRNGRMNDKELGYIYALAKIGAEDESNSGEAVRLIFEALSHSLPTVPMPREHQQESLPG